MRVSIFFKEKPHEPMTYEITLDEFKRLSADYQQFIEAGKPDHGVYWCYTNGQPSGKLSSPLALIFIDIASIV